MSCGTGPRKSSQLRPAGKSRGFAAIAVMIARLTVPTFQLGGAGGRTGWPAGGVAGAIAGGLVCGPGI